MLGNFNFPGLLQHVEQNYGALFSLGTLKDGIETFKRPFGDSDLVAGRKAAMGALGCVGLMAELLNEFVGHRYRRVAEMDDAKHAAGRADRAPVAVNLIQVDK